VETALYVHHLIVHGLRLRRLTGRRRSPAAALLHELNAIYGEEQTRIVIDDFSLVYGCDPFTFLEHLSDCR
jgi:hypothetical protein